RQVFKRTLSVTKINILYARVTLTRFTTLYFFFAIITCIILSGLQGVTFTDNSNAISALTAIVGNNRLDHGIVVLEGRTLRLCDSIPHQAGTNCTDVLTFGPKDLQNRSAQEVCSHYSNGGNDTSPVSANQDSSVILHASCILSLRWLDETIQDNQREDVVTFGFELWLFVLALVTILNESIPHLVAAVLGHIFGTAWSGYRVQSMKNLRSIYQNYILPEACDNHDLLGNWWDIRIDHGIPVVVMNCVALIALSLLSVKLFRVYTTESFSRVGASAKVHRMYKIVLLFSVCLQLSGFFSVAASGMWIDKVCHGAVRQLAAHSKLYLAAFIVTLVVGSKFSGWVCVRKECKIRFGIFIAISVFLLVISTLMFESPLYRFIFACWPLFRTMTVTAYVLIVITTILAVLCRLNFGKGLAHYLQVTDALEGMDFTPVVFPKEKDDGRDLEKYDIADSELAPINAPFAPMTIRVPAAAFSTSGKPKTGARGQSVYSDVRGSAVYISSTPPLVSELSAAPRRLSR
ncbi:hypothetical protein BJ912DRAFT_822266, partial [Pholiota molesta]